MCLVSMNGETGLLQPGKTCEARNIPHQAIE
jgi:hypothetical protein